MKKIILTLIIVLSVTITSAQEQKHFSVYGGFGLGFALVTNSSSIFSIQYHLSARYDAWTLKASTIRNGKLIEVFETPSELKSVTSRSILFGYTHNIYRPLMDTNNILSEVNVNIYSGWSNVNSIRSGDVDISTSNGFFSGKYQKITETASGIPVEFEIEWRMRDYVGLTFGLYSNFNRIRNIQAINFNVIFGFF